MIGAHIMGVPVEESVLSIAPAFAALVAVTGAQLRRGRAARKGRRAP